MGNVDSTPRLNSETQGRVCLSYPTGRVMKLGDLILLQWLRAVSGDITLLYFQLDLCVPIARKEKKNPSGTGGRCGQQAEVNPKGLWRSAMIPWSGPDLALRGDLPCCLLWLLAMPPVRFFFIHSPPWLHLKWQWGELRFGNVQIVSPLFARVCLRPKNCFKAWTITVFVAWIQELFGKSFKNLVSS